MTDRKTVVKLDLQANPRNPEIQAVWERVAANHNGQVLEQGNITPLKVFAVFGEGMFSERQSPTCVLLAAFNNAGTANAFKDAVNEELSSGVVGIGAGRAIVLEPLAPKDSPFPNQYRDAGPRH
jgi:hypothetical protein